jgi:hypothetical protein
VEEDILLLFPLNATATDAFVIDDNLSYQLILNEGLIVNAYIYLY